MTSPSDNDNNLINTLASDFEQNGYAIVEDFLTNQEVETIRTECTRLIHEESIKERDKAIFANDNNCKSKYFLESGDKVRYFFEKNAFCAESSKLLVPEDQSLAKIGHALHILNPIFKQATYSTKIKSVFRAIKFVDPTVVQSMVIFKNPKVGGEYTPHQDASFLCSSPIHLAGIWIALDDATEQNGCLQFIPGSHRTQLARRMVRLEQVGPDGEMLGWTGSPVDYDESKFVKTPVKRGALVLIHGLVVHRSDANLSEQPRWIYTFHAFDKGRAVYLRDNWLQTKLLRSESQDDAEDLVDAYMSYLDTDTSEHKQKVENAIDECLTHLEEVCSALEDYRKTSDKIEDPMKVVSGHKKQLDILYKQVDHIEQYLFDLNQNLIQIEQSLEDLESMKKPVKSKIRQLIGGLIPRLSLAGFGSSIGETYGSDAEDFPPQSGELIARVVQIRDMLTKSTKDLCDQIKTRNKENSD